MTLFEAISVRKSVRKYSMTPLPAETLAQLDTFLENAKRLYPDIQTEHQLAGAGGAKGMFLVKAPHYLIISSEEKDGYLENIGFLYQQADLFLSSQGLGACWLGMAKPVEAPDTRLKFVITMALGKPEESPYREKSEFNRKPLPEIAQGDDPRLPYARIAPSATNSQPWFARKEGGDLLIYRRPPKGLMARHIGPMNQIDMGIFLCHLYVAGEKLGMPFDFKTAPAVPDKELIFVGRI